MRKNVFAALVLAAALLCGAALPAYAEAVLPEAPASAPAEGPAVESEPAPAEEPAVEDEPAPAQPPEAADAQELSAAYAASSDAPDLPPRLDKPVGDINWSLSTIDGKTITKSDFAGKTILFVFYRATLVNGSGQCPNSNAIISALAKSSWIGANDVQIIAVDGDGNPSQNVSAYKAIYAPDCNDIIFTWGSNGKNLNWQFHRLYSAADGMTFAHCVIIKNDTLCYAWEGAYSARPCQVALSQLSSVPDPNPKPVTIDGNNFPDANFRAYVSNTLDTDKNGTLAGTELEIRSINVNGRNISSLKGVEFFPALGYLNCANNQLASLDVSRNPVLETLYVSDNQLTRLDVSGNPKLRSLDCGENQLTRLDVSGNPALYSLWCNDNRLTALDVGSNPALAQLKCSNNQLPGLDVSKNPKLYTFYVSTQKITLQAQAAGGGWQVDLRQAVPENLLGRVTVKDCPYQNGVVTLGQGVTGFTYEFDTKSPTENPRMEVEVSCPHAQQPDPGTQPGTQPGTSADESRVRAFVTRLYEVCLGRTPDEDGLDGWTDALISHRNTGSEAAYGFIFSDEFKAKNYCNSCYIDHLYSAFMGREPDTEGHAAWMRVLEEEGQSREHVFNGFVGSNEFKAICAQYGIDPGTGTAEPEGVGTVRRGTCAGCGATDGVEDFVVRLYRVCLDRGPDENAQAWMENLRMHKDTGRTAAEGFIFSDEFKARGFDNETFVQYLYRAFFDRVPKDGEEGIWLTKLNNGGSREDVVPGFTGSDEFAVLCRRYGILAQ